MDVSVVIPTRDRPELLALTLRTALWQEGVSTEVLVVDDGARPDTETLVRQLGEERVRLVRNTGPAGVSGARNTGIAAARGGWIAFLDDDDLWAPSKLAMQLASAQDVSAGWAYGGDVSVDHMLRVRVGAPPPSPEVVVAGLRRHNAVPAGASNVVVRRDVLEAVGGFDPQLRTSEDWDLWIRLSRSGLPACVRRPLVALRMHAGMASRAVDQMLADVQLIARRHGIPVDYARHERWAAWMCLQAGRRVMAMRHYARAAAGGDLGSLGRAAVGLLYPGVARVRTGEPTNAWCVEAQGWLEALRPASSAHVSQ
jgi:glycosyltransferase involved in cell wall biosynthesis